MFQHIPYDQVSKMISVSHYACHSHGVHNAIVIIWIQLSSYLYCVCSVHRLLQMVLCLHTLVYVYWAIYNWKCHQDFWTWWTNVKDMHIASTIENDGYTHCLFHSWCFLHFLYSISLSSVIITFIVRRSRQSFKVSVQKLCTTWFMIAAIAGTGMMLC